MECQQETCKWCFRGYIYQVWWNVSQNNSSNQRRLQWLIAILRVQYCNLYIVLTLISILQYYTALLTVCSSYTLYLVVYIVKAYRKQPAFSRRLALQYFTVILSASLPYVKNEGTVSIYIIFEPNSFFSRIILIHGNVHCISKLNTTRLSLM